MMQIDEYIKTHCGGSVKEFNTRFSLQFGGHETTVHPHHLRVVCIDDIDTLVKVYATRIPPMLRKQAGGCPDED